MICVMRYSAWTLLIATVVLAALAPEEVSVPDTPALANEIPTDVVEPETVTELEWTDLRFEILDRITFDVSQLPDHIRALDDRRVRIRGYFHGGAAASDVNEFLLLGEVNTPPVVSKFGVPLEEFPVDGVATVKLTGSRTTTFVRDPIAVTGRLTFKVIHFDGKVVCVIRLIADSVEPVQPRAGFGPVLVNGC